MEPAASTTTDRGWWYRADVEHGVNACRVITDLFPPGDAGVLTRALDEADLFAAGVTDYGELRGVRVEVESVLAELAERAGGREHDGLVEVESADLAPAYLAVLAVRAAIHRQPERAQVLARDARARAQSVATPGRGRNRWRRPAR